MSLFSSKSKNEIEKLVEENDELKNTLHTVLQKHQNLSELDNKLTETRKQFIELQKQTEKLKNEIETKTQPDVLTSNTIDTRKDEIDNLDKRYNDLKFAHEKLLNEYNSVQNNVASLRLEEEKLIGIIGQYGGNIEEAITRQKEIEAELIERIFQLRNEETKRNATIQILDDKITLSEDIKSNLELSLSAILGQLAEKEKNGTNKPCRELKN